MLGVLRYLVPYDEFALRSDLPATELMKRLDPYVTPPAPLFRTPSPGPYLGTVSSNGFRIKAATFIRNNFQPIIVGSFVAVHDGTIIRVRQRLGIVVSIFMTFWFGFLLVFAGVAIQSGNIDAILHAALMLAFGLLLVNGGFWYEARHSRDELARIFGIPTE